MSRTKVLVVGGGGVGCIVALNLVVGGQADVQVVLRSNYAAVKSKGFRIDSVDHGRLESWRPEIEYRSNLLMMFTTLTSE